jgi:alpha-tubulin suppressor-like RCC1 family protein
VTAGTHHVLAVGSEGDVFSWGQGSRGQLGLGTDDNQLATYFYLLSYCTGIAKSFEFRHYSFMFVWER